MHQSWHTRQRPPRLERRLEFADYEATRAFLDQAAKLSEQTGIYPDMSFGRTYVNITIHADEGADAVGLHQQRFAQALDALIAEE